MPEANGRHPEHSTSRPVAAPCSAANVGRLVWGLLFLVSSVVNLLVTLPNPELYAVFADLTFLPCHRWLLLHVALPNASVISVLVVLFELATAILLSSKGRAVHWGLITTGLWSLFVTPAMGWYTLFSPVLLIIPALLLRFEYDRSLLDLALKGDHVP